MIVEEELVSFHQDLVKNSHFVAGYFVLDDLGKLQVVIANCLTTEHDHCVLVGHMEPYQPDLLLLHDVNYGPTSLLRVKLLDRCPVSIGFIAHCIDESFRKCAAVWAADSLAELR